jgi:hypothetical protein
MMHGLRPTCDTQLNGTITYATTGTMYDSWLPLQFDESPGITYQKMPAPS